MPFIQPMWSVCLCTLVSRVLSELLNRFKAGVYCCAAPPCYRCIPSILLPSAPASQMVSLQELIQPSHMCATQTLTSTQTQSERHTRCRINWAAHMHCYTCSDCNILCHTWNSYVHTHTHTNKKLYIIKKHTCPQEYQHAVLVIFRCIHTLIH